MFFKNTLTYKTYIVDTKTEYSGSTCASDFGSKRANFDLI